MRVSTAISKLWLPHTLVIMLFAGSVAHAASSVTDPAGDYDGGTSCGGLICEPFQDITAAEITHVAGGLRMTMTLAASPSTAVLTSPGVKEITWAWRFDTDPSTFPKGYPLPNGIDSPFEAIVEMRYDGTHFYGQTVDRRPLLSGADAIVTPITVNIIGNGLSVVVPTGALSLPDGLRWRATTNGFMGTTGSLGQYPVDVTTFVTLNAGD
jgi:hypothetical protein